MSKKYQNSTSENTAAAPVVTVPAEVTVALQELTGQVQEGLLSLRAVTAENVASDPQDEVVNAA